MTCILDIDNIIYTIYIYTYMCLYARHTVFKAACDAGASLITLNLCERDVQSCTVPYQRWRCFEFCVEAEDAVSLPPLTGVIPTRFAPRVLENWRFAFQLPGALVCKRLQRQIVIQWYGMIRLTQETGTLATRLSRLSRLLSRNIVTSRPPHIVTVLKLQLSGSIAFEQTYFLLNFLSLNFHLLQNPFDFFWFGWQSAKIHCFTALPLLTFWDKRPNFRPGRSVMGKERSHGKVPSRIPCDSIASGPALMQTKT